MSTQFKTVGFWMTATSAVIGFGAVVMELTREQTDSLMALAGALIAAITSFGYLQAEAKVRAAKLRAYLDAVNCPAAAGATASSVDSAVFKLIREA